MPRLLDGIIVIRGGRSDGSDPIAIPYYARSNRIGDFEIERTGFGGPGVTDGGDGNRTEGGPTSRVWIKEK